MLSGSQDDLQNKFQVQFTSLESEIRKRDEIISQLQARIIELESCLENAQDLEDNSAGDSTEHDASLEEDLDDDGEDHPFMRDGSVDTVLTTSRTRYSHRRSWEEHSEEETLELQELPNSIVPQNLWRNEVAIDLESNNSTDENHSENEESGDDQAHNNWEVVMLAEQLEARRRSNDNTSPGS